MSRDLVLDASAGLEAILGRPRAVDVLDLIEGRNDGPRTGSLCSGGR